MRFTPHSYGNRGAFSLMEFLLVAILVGIILVLLFPFYRQVRENSNKAVCLSNLRKLSSILFTYSADNNGEMVPSVVYVSPSNRNTGTPWVNWLIDKGYLVEEGFDPGKTYQDLKRGILTCPSRETLGSAIYNKMHYGMNYTLGFGGAMENFGYRTPQILPNRAKVTSPSRTLMLGETKINYMIKAEARFLDEGSSQNIAFPHRNRMNVIFMDGHAEESSPPWKVPKLAQPGDTYPFF